MRFKLNPQLFAGDPEPTDLPTNNIKQITISGVTYDIIPTMMQNNGYLAALRALDHDVELAFLEDLPAGEMNVNFNDTTTVATAGTLNNIVVGNSIDGYIRYTVSGGGGGGTDIYVYDLR